MRLSYEELDKIKKENNIDDLWSYSRYSSYLTSPYEFFLHYIKKERPSNEMASAYAPMGTVAHDLVERYYNGEIQVEEMLEEYDNQFTLQIDMLGLRFDKSDDEKNEKIRNKYYENIRNYFEHFMPLNPETTHDIVMEDFVLIKITDNIFFNGYIDQHYEDDDGYFNIVDLKTSSQYKGQDLIDHSHQLVLYAEGMRQRGIPAEKIRCYFNFLKYATFNFEQVNGKKNSQNVERINLADVVSKKTYSWMKKHKIADYEEIFEKLKSNPYEINTIPELVKAGFSVTDCYVEVEQPFEIFEQLKIDIIQTVNEIEELKKEYEKTGNERLWYDTEDNLKKQEYYINQLCDYSISQHKPYAEYLKKKEDEKEFANNLLGVTKKDDDEDWMKELFG